MAHVTAVKSEVIPFGQLAATPPVEPPLGRNAPLFDEAECHACAPTPSEEAKADERYVSVIVGVAICALLAYAYYHSK